MVGSSPGTNIFHKLTPQGPNVVGKFQLFTFWLFHASNGHEQQIFREIFEIKKWPIFDPQNGQISDFTQIGVQIQVIYTIISGRKIDTKNRISSRA